MYDILSIVIALAITGIMLFCTIKTYIVAYGILLNPHPKFKDVDVKFSKLKPQKTQTMFECKVI